MVIYLIDTLSEALTRFGEDKNGTYLSGSFQDLGADLLFIESKNEVFKRNPGQLFSYIGQDLWNISTIADRLEWTRLNSIRNADFEERWCNYASVDIEYFHVEFRSIMDYSALIIAEFHGLSGKLPESYRRLAERINKYERKLPQSMVSLIRSTEWFWEVRAVRDSLLHWGGRSMVFGEPSEGILFQVHDQKLNNLIHNKILMHNQNVVYFEKYLPYYFSNLLIYLDKMAHICYESTAFVSKNPRAISYSSGFGVIKHWIESLLCEQK